MTLSIVGAGSVGLTLAARLSASGQAVRLRTRRPEAAQALCSHGLRTEHAATGARGRFQVDAIAASEATAWDGDPVLLCTRGDAVEEACEQLAALSPASLVVTFQNDVVSEEVAGRHVERVAGGVWRETCTQLSDHEVRFLTDRPGRAILGVHPKGEHAEVVALAGSLENAGIRTGVSAEIGADKWLKLCVNLMSAPNALVVRQDHSEAAFVQIKVQLLEEARSVLRAAGIHPSSCDGQDRSLDEEIEFQQASLSKGTSARPIPLYNQVWRALQRRGWLEADAYHDRIIRLGEEHGIPTPANRRTLEILLRASNDRTGPEKVRALQLLG